MCLGYNAIMLTLESSCLTVLALLGVGCATSGHRPSAAAAILGSSKTVVESIDERNVRAEGGNPANAQFEIPPGRHAIEVSLESDSSVQHAATDPATITVCFNAVAGRTYLTQPIIEGSRWRPEIVDEFTGSGVSTGCAEAPDTSSAANGPDTIVSPSSGEKLALASLPVPPRAGRDSNLPGSGLTAGVGFFFGGESLYKVTFSNAPDRNLNAGRGVLVTAGGLWTPLWIDDQFGFGAGASIGWKYDSISASNGEVTLTRFPVSATVHSLIRLGKLWYTLLSGGLIKEVGGQVSGSGFAAAANASFTSSLGLLGEGAIYHTLGPATLGAIVRYSSSHDWLEDTQFDASSVGVIASAQYNF